MHLGIAQKHIKLAIKKPTNTIN